MLSQDENLAFDASAQTRQTGGTLTPISDYSLNSIDGGKKRKRDGNTMEDLLKDPFIVRVGTPILPSGIYADLRTAISFHGPC